MVPTGRLKAHELVCMLAGLLKLDVKVLGRVANVPTRNLMSWLAGRRDNLRLHSVMALMSLLGLKFGDSIRLDDQRVHFWQIDDRMFAGKDAVYGPLTRLSKLLADCMLTRVLPPKPSMFASREYFMVWGEGVRVVIVVRKSLFKAPKINPDVIRGACWRDEDDRHAITTNARLWALLTEKDLTAHEFDRIFQQVQETVTWVDLSLMAREFGVTPQLLSEFVMREYGEVEAEDTAGRGIEVDGGGRFLALAHSRAA